MEFRESLRILVVEDNHSDVELLKEAFYECRLNTKIKSASDGVEALEYLRSLDVKNKEAFPQLILLDLNMPRKDGREFLAEIQKERILKLIPVCVLTSSEAESDVFRAYELQANCYIRKPSEFSELIRIAQSLHNFWWDTAVLPWK